MEISKKPIIVDFFAGPGSRKTTTCYGVAYKLKLRGYECLYLEEVASELTRKKDFFGLQMQHSIVAEQITRLNIAMQHDFDVIVMDTSLLNSLVYSKNIGKDFHSEKLSEWILDVYKKYDFVTYYLKRPENYSNVGRYNSKEQAIAIDNEIEDVLIKNNIKHRILEPNGEETVNNIINDLLEKLR